MEDLSLFSKSHFKFAAELSWLSTLFFVLKRTIRFCQFLNQTSSGYFSPGYLSFASTFRYELTFQTFTWVEKIYFKFLMRKLNESLFATDQATLTRIQAVSYSHALSLSLTHTHPSTHALRGALSRALTWTFCLSLEISLTQTHPFSLFRLLSLPLHMTPFSVWFEDLLACDCWHLLRNGAVLLKS